MSTQTYTATLVIIECCSCHMDFGMTKEFERDRRRDHDWFYCPKGHVQHFTGKSDVEVAQEETARLRRQAEWAETRRLAAVDQAETAERRRRAAKGQLTKTRKRIANGVCPCCNRTFPNVADHMATKHPDYAPPTEGAK